MSDARHVFPPWSLVLARNMNPDDTDFVVAPSNLSRRHCAAKSLSIIFGLLLSGAHRGSRIELARGIAVAVVGADHVVAKHHHHVFLDIAAILNRPADRERH